MNKIKKKLITILLVIYGVSAYIFGRMCEKC